MLTIVVPGVELFDDAKQEFFTKDDVVIELEHSLVSLSKWESKYEKPFLTKSEKTVAEMFDYIKAMIVTPNIPEEVFNRLTEANVEAINKHINQKMTATWFQEDLGAPSSGETVTAELIYYWMVAFQIPKECENWHLNRLFTLIRVANVKNSKPKKMSRSDQLRRQHEINERRRAEFNTSG